MQEALEMNELLRRAGAAGMLGMGNDDGDYDDDDGDLYDP
jgi:N-acyl-D-aspartate/D-glutamate deacylase